MTESISLTNPIEVIIIAVRIEHHAPNVVKCTTIVKRTGQHIPFGIVLIKFAQEGGYHIIILVIKLGFTHTALQLSLVITNNRDFYISFISFRWTNAKQRFALYIDNFGGIAANRNFYFTHVVTEISAIYHYTSPFTPLGRQKLLYYNLLFRIERSTRILIYIQGTALVTRRKKD